MYKKTPKLLFSLATILVLTACGGGNQTTPSTSEDTHTSSSDSSASSDITSSTPSSSEDTTSSAGTTSSADSTSSSGSSSSASRPQILGDITLHTQGDFFINQQLKSVYAFYADPNEPISWSVDNTELATITLNENNTHECYLSFGSETGTITVTACLTNATDVYASATYEIKSGEAIGETQLAQFQGGAKFSTTWNMYSYDEELNATLEDTSTFVTIYEEYGNNTEFYTTTDAYQMKEWDNNGALQFESKWVSSNHRLATEVIDLNNEIAYEYQYNDEDQVIRFENTYYINMFGSSYINATEWQTIDEGKTYHFTGQNFYLSTYLFASLILTDHISADDMYFDFTGESPKFVAIVDPYSSSGGTRYGSRFECVLSEVGTATIEHLQPYAHETYHDAIDTAIQTMAASTNYRGTVTIDGGTEFVYTYTEDTIDITRIDVTGRTSRSGVHKTADSEYYEYYVENGNVYIDAYHHTPWNNDSVRRYPTFDFASEIFGETATNNKFDCRQGAETFIFYTTYYPVSSLLIDTIEDGYITLDGQGHLAEAYSNIEYTDGSSGSVKVEYSDFGTASVNLDFSSATEPDEPTSWADENSSLYDSLVNNQALNDIPYKYCEFGWQYGTSWNRDDESYLYFGTENWVYDTDEAVTAAIEQWISEYEALLVENGYTLSTEKETRTPNVGANLYVKGDVTISVAREMNWSGTIPLDSLNIVYHREGMVYYYDTSDL